MERTDGANGVHRAEQIPAGMWLIGQRGSRALIIGRESVGDFIHFELEFGTVTYPKTALVQVGQRYRELQVPDDLL